MNCNILLLGQTGVGKSSLLNYLAGETLAESGISAGTGGVTHGINKYNIILNGQPCQVFDSEGLELTHEKKWRDLVNKELFPKKDQDKLSKWYHIVIFCIGANSSRIQDFELSFLQEIIEKKYGVIIALTKADLATEDELSGIIGEIKNHFEDNSQLVFVPVCSKQRRGNHLEGKEEICLAVIDSWERTLLNRLPEHVYSPVYDLLSNWHEQTIIWLSEQKTGLFQSRKKDVLNELNDRIQSICDKTNVKVATRQEKAFKEIAGINKALGQALDYKSVTSMKTSLSLKIEKLENSFVFNENAGLKFAVAGGLAALSFFFPIVGPALSLISLAIGRFNNKSSEELRDALEYQYATLVKLYTEREFMFEYVLADMLGYYYGTREVAIGALKGRGIEKNDDLFSEKIKEVENLIIENGIEDGRGEYYIAYHYFSSYLGKKSTEKGKQWLKRAVSHKYPDAIAVYSFGDVISRMKEQEQKEEKENYNYWYGE